MYQRSSTCFLNNSVPLCKAHSLLEQLSHKRDTQLGSTRETADKKKRDLKTVNSYSTPFKEKVVKTAVASKWEEKL